MVRLSKKQSSARRIGFTLLEMVIVLAIMLMLFTYLVATFQVIEKGHTGVAMINDLHDYASMNLKAIANNLCNSTSIGSTGKTISVADGNHVVVDSNKLLPSYTQYPGNANGARWALRLSFTTDSARKMVYVTINMYDSKEGNSLAYSDNISIYCPACKEMADITNASSIVFSTQPVTT